MWIKFNPNPMDRNVGDCVIRAICAALDVDCETAFEMTATNAYQMADMPSSNAVLASVLRQHGFYRKAIPDSCPDCYTAHDFCEDHPYGVYVLGFGDHVATVIDGNILDSFDSSQEIPQYSMNGGNSYGMGGGNSYRNNNTMYRGNSYRNSYNGMNGGYSRNGDTMDKLHQLMNEAQTEQEREAIRRVMKTM